MAVKVLVVDDTDHVREMLAQMLELDGFEVVGAAAGGAEALEILPGLGPDVVVIDYKMPAMDGITATRHIRELDRTVPVILYTAYLDEDLETRAHDAGVSACIGKVEGIATLEREISALCIELADRSVR